MKAQEFDKSVDTVVALINAEKFESAKETWAKLTKGMSFSEMVAFKEQIKLNTTQKS